LRHEDNNSFTRRLEEEADDQSNETTPNQKLDLNEKDGQMPSNEINMYVSQSKSKLKK